MGLTRMIRKAAKNGATKNVRTKLSRSKKIPTASFRSKKHRNVNLTKCNVHHHQRVWITLGELFLELFAFGLYSWHPQHSRGFISLEKTSTTNFISSGCDTCSIFLAGAAD